MSSIGEILREARLKKGLSEEAASRTLKIKACRLRDLEENRYDDFPAKIYARSFLKNYANLLQLDADTLLDQFTTENPAPTDSKPVFAVTEEQRSQTPIQRHVPTSRPFLLSSTGKTVMATILALLAIGGGLVWWNSHRADPSPIESLHIDPYSPTPSVTNDLQPSSISSAPMAITNQAPAETHRSP